MQRHVFINNIFSIIINSFSYLCADCKIWRGIKTLDDVQLLQDNSMNFSNWCLNKRLNVNKCEVLRCARMNKKILAQYNLDGNALYF